MTEPTIVTAYNQTDVEINALKAKVELVTNRLNNLKGYLTDELRAFAENHLNSGDSAYEDLHNIMEANDLGGLKRTFQVSVRVSYWIETEVEAADEADAQRQVEDNINSIAHDHIYVSDVYDCEVDSVYEC